jgi:hypothetical protein
LRRPQRNADHVLFGHVAAFTDGFGNFHRLAKAETDPAMLVACDNECAKAKTAAAFDDFGRAIDENDFLGQFGPRSTVARAVALGRRGTRTATAIRASTATARTAASRISRKTLL